MAIKECHEEQGYPIDVACGLFHVARSACHKWDAGKLSRRTEENKCLADKIEKIHGESPDKGCRRLNDDLRHDYGIHVNDKRVLRICRIRDIRSTVKYSNHGCTRRAKNPRYIAENLQLVLGLTGKTASIIIQGLYTFTRHFLTFPVRRKTTKSHRR